MSKNKRSKNINLRKRVLYMYMVKMFFICSHCWTKTGKISGFPLQIIWEQRKIALSKLGILLVHFNLKGVPLIGWALGLGLSCLEVGPTLSARFRFAWLKFGDVISSRSENYFSQTHLSPQLLIILLYNVFIILLLLFFFWKTCGYIIYNYIFINQKPVIDNYDTTNLVIFLNFFPCT